MDKLEELNKKIQNYKKKNPRKNYKKNKLVFNSLNVALEIVGAILVGLLI